MRIDSCAFSGWTVPSHYDSLISKLVVYRPTRAEAIDTMRRALKEYIIEGIQTTIPFHQEVLSNARFISGDYDTSFADGIVLP